MLRNSCASAPFFVFVASELRAPPPPQWVTLPFSEKRHLWRNKKATKLVGRRSTEGGGMVTHPFNALSDFQQQQLLLSVVNRFWFSDSWKSWTTPSQKSKKNKAKWLRMHLCHRNLPWNQWVAYTWILHVAEWMFAVARVWLLLVLQP